MPSVHPNPSGGLDCVAPLREFEKAMHEFTTKQEAPMTPQQLRRSTLQAGESTGRRSVSILFRDGDLDNARRRENGERATPLLHSALAPPSPHP